jgi:hypothetical protein
MFMTDRILFAIFLATATVSSGFGQTIADVARAERARREAVPSLGTLVDADGKPPSHDALTEEALRVSGARKQLEQALERALQSAAIQKQPQGISKEEYQRILAEAFNRDRLIQVMEKSFGETASDKALTDVILWYHSPLGQKILMAEVNSDEADAAAELQRFAGTIKQNPPSGNRMRLVQQLEEQTQATSRTVQLLLSIVMSVYKGATDAGAEIPPPPPDFEKLFQAQVTPPLRQALRLKFLFVYRSVLENELLGYHAFLKSQSATAFNNSVWNAMNASFAVGGQHLGRKIAEAMQKQ